MRTFRHWLNQNITLSIILTFLGTLCTFVYGYSTINSTLGHHIKEIEKISVRIEDLPGQRERVSQLEKRLDRIEDKIQKIGVR